MGCFESKDEGGNSDSTGCDPRDSASERRSFENYVRESTGLVQNMKAEIFQIQAEREILRTAIGEVLQRIQVLEDSGDGSRSKSERKLSLDDFKESSNDEGTLHTIKNILGKTSGWLGGNPSSTPPALKEESSAKGNVSEQPDLKQPRPLPPITLAGLKENTSDDENVPPNKDNIDDDKLRDDSQDEESDTVLPIPKEERRPLLNLQRGVSVPEGGSSGQVVVDGNKGRRPVMNRRAFSTSGGVQGDRTSKLSLKYRPQTTSQVSQENRAYQRTPSEESKSFQWSSRASSISEECRLLKPCKLLWLMMSSSRDLEFEYEALRRKSLESPFSKSYSIPIGVILSKSSLITTQFNYLIFRLVCYINEGSLQVLLEILRHPAKLQNVVVGVTLLNRSLQQHASWNVTTQHLEWQEFYYYEDGATHFCSHIGSCALEDTANVCTENGGILFRVNCKK